MEFPREVPPSIACSQCSQQVVVPDETPYDMFGGAVGLCPHCNKHLDWWDSILSWIDMRPPFAESMVPVGIRTTLTRITLRRNELMRLEFKDHGVPLGAKVVQINYTPTEQGLFPVEIHGNSPIREMPQSGVTLYGRTVGDDPPPYTSMNMYIAWTPESRVDDVWPVLVSAFEAYQDGRFDDVVMPASIAVETRMTRLMYDFFKKYGGSRQILKGFLRSEATYFHQLNSLLPGLLSFTDAPQLRKEIVNGLNRLAELRNDIAHSGQPEEPVEQHGAASMICAALFGVHYTRVIEPYLLR